MFNCVVTRLNERRYRARTDPEKIDVRDVSGRVRQWPVRSGAAVPLHLSEP